MIIFPEIERVKCAELVQEIAKHPENSVKFISFRIPKGYSEPLVKFLKSAEGKLHLVLGKIRTIKSDKAHRCVFGWCSDIAEQFANAGLYDGYTLEDIKVRVYEAMKRLAVTDGAWPTQISPVDGSIEPVSITLVSQDAVNSILQIIKRFADENDMYLTEVISGEIVKCLGGKALTSTIKSDTMEEGGHA